MGRAFSFDFAAVRIHTGPAAHNVASALGAQALTAGTDILFGAGAYRPGTPDGDQLLAHELAHVVQQAHGLPRGTLDRGAADPLERAAGLAADHASPAAESEASGAAMVAARGGSVPALSYQPPTIARQDLDTERCDPLTQSCPVEEDIEAGMSRIDTEMAAELARIDARSETSQPVAGNPPAPTSALPLASVVQSGQTYAFAATAGFASTTGYSVPEGVLASKALAAQGTATAEGLVAARGLTSAGTAVVEGSTLARSLIAGGEAILAVEAGGAGEAEAVSGPPGWIIGAVVLLAAGAAIGVGYLLLRKPSATAATGQQTAGTGATATPQAPARRHADQTCEDAVLDRLKAEKERICNSIPGESCSASKVSPKRLARRPCSEIRLRIQAFRDCLAIRQRIQDECFGGVPDKVHKDAISFLENGLNACLALEAVNCAPGHPMANL